jgi:ribosomal protein S12 methylthiotransferase
MKNKPCIAIITMGCSKNTVDSEVLAGQFTENNLNVQFDNAVGADAVIVNTCGFIGDAMQESVETILQYLDLKKAGKLKKVFVMGCLAQRYAEDLKKEFPEADGFFGVTEFQNILDAIKSGNKPYSDSLRYLSTPSHYAYLKISEGCDRKCSFCAIPAIRGKNISRTEESLLAEAEYLSKLGVKELNVIAQDTTQYGMDLYGKKMLASLLEKLANTDKFEWIRLHYTFPAGFPKEVLNVIADYPQICRYIDIPLQHINDRILKSMKRGTTALKTNKLLDQIRKTIPDVAIRTAFIVGYPGETRAEFNELVKFIKEQKFDRAGVFTFSPEEGTSAYQLKDSVSEKTKQMRAGELMEIQQEISYTINQSRVGKTMKVIVDNTEGDYYIGRTEFDSPEVDNEVLILRKGRKLQTGNFYNLKITGAEAFDLMAE